MSDIPPYVTFYLGEGKQTANTLTVTLTAAIPREVGDVCLKKFRNGYQVQLDPDFQEVLLDALRADNLELAEKLRKAEAERDAALAENQKMKRALSVLDLSLR